MCNRAGLLIGWDDASKRALVCRANCDTWKCDECAKRMSEIWGLRAVMGARKIIAQGDQLDFITITSHEKLKTFSATEAIWKKAWNPLYNAIKRQKLALEYIVIPECHKNGRMHVHALWNAEVSKKWLKDNARRRGLGYQCEIRHISSAGRAAEYVTKYIGKSLDFEYPARFRRVRCSNDWVDIPKPATEHAELRWEYVGTNGALQIVYDECQSKHIAMIDQKTGEKFDDVDLGTIVSYA